MMDRLEIACTTRLSLRKTRLYSSRESCNNVCRMATPRCALGVHCQHPQLALRSGHKCRRCRREVHVLCAEEDPQADASENLTCRRRLVGRRPSRRRPVRRGLDDSFNLEAHPYDKMKTKKSFRPTLVLFKKELKRRDLLLIVIWTLL
jgi:hypothetical protein